jgi:hypothetical protein
VWDFGQSLEVALNEAEDKAKQPKDKKAKRLAVLHVWLGPGGRESKQYRDPGTNPDGMAKRA